MWGSITLKQFEHLFWLMGSQKWAIIFARAYNNNNNNNNICYTVLRSLQYGSPFPPLKKRIIVTFYLKILRKIIFFQLSQFSQKWVHFYYSTGNNNNNNNSDNKYKRHRIVFILFFWYVLLFESTLQFESQWGSSWVSRFWIPAVMWVFRGWSILYLCVGFGLLDESLRVSTEHEPRHLTVQTHFTPGVVLHHTAQRKHCETRDWHLTEPRVHVNARTRFSNTFKCESHRCETLTHSNRTTALITNPSVQHTNQRWQRAFAPLVTECFVKLRIKCEVRLNWPFTSAMSATFTVTPVTSHLAIQSRVSRCK